MIENFTQEIVIKIGKQYIKFPTIAKAVDWTYKVTKGEYSKEFIRSQFDNYEFNINE